MTEPDIAGSRQHVLDPTDRFSEVVFGVLMAMAFTGTARIASAGEQDIQHLLYAALGGTLAWGVVDAVMYVIASVADRGWTRRVVRAIGEAKDAAEGRRIVAGNLPEGLAAVLSASSLDDIRAAIGDGRLQPPPARVTRADLVGAASVFSLVLFGTLPVALPFVFFSEVALALRVSNGIGLTLLFLHGSALGHYAGFGAWRSGLTMLAIGAALVSLVIALGG